MSKAEKVEDGNMEDILASIRKIIAEDPGGAPRPALGASRPPLPPSAPHPRLGPSIRKPASPVTGVDDVLDDLANIVQPVKSATPQATPPPAPPPPQFGPRHSAPPPAAMAVEPPSWLSPKESPAGQENADRASALSSSIGHELAKPFFGLGAPTAGKPAREPELPPLPAGKPDENKAGKSDFGAIVPRRGDSVSGSVRIRADRDPPAAKDRRSGDAWPNSSDPFEDLVVASPHASLDAPDTSTAKNTKPDKQDSLLEEIGALRDVLDPPVVTSTSAGDAPAAKIDHPLRRKTDLIGRVNGHESAAPAPDAAKDGPEKDKPASGGLLRSTIAGLMPRREESQPASSAAQPAPPIRANPRRFSFNVNAEPNPPEKDAVEPPVLAARSAERKPLFADKPTPSPSAEPAKSADEKSPEPVVESVVARSPGLEPAKTPAVPTLSSPVQAASTAPVQLPLAAIAGLPAAAPGAGGEPVRTLEDTVAELLRPMLRQWLDANMPRIVEKALKVELAESAKKKN